MANINAPHGLLPVRYLSGACYNGQANTYCIPSTDGSQYGIGDIVISATGADANGIPNVAKATATSVPRGVIVGIDPSGNSGVSLVAPTLDLAVTTIPATKAKAYYVMVCDDPNVIFEAQFNNTATLTAVATGSQNVKPVIANPATTTSFSGTYLDKDNINTTNSFMLTILSMRRKPGDDLTAYAKFLVKFNVHEMLGSRTAPS